MNPAPLPAPAAARNACKLCAPLGACVVFAGIEGCVPFLHGGQGCATYIRRYLISHFREPVDIGSSSFGEEDTVFGGARNLQAGLGNIASQYRPKAIGVATTCLAETIGEDVPRILAGFSLARGGSAPPLVHVSTPSYTGTHLDGFHAAVRAVVQRFAVRGPAHGGVNVFPGFVSSEDLRHLKEWLAIAGLPGTVLPDYADTLDGGSWSEYERLQPGGTSLNAIAAMAGAQATFELGRTLATSTSTAGAWLAQEFGVRHVRLGLPVGLRETDRFLATLGELAGRPDLAADGRDARGGTAATAGERARLIDAMVDGHKVLFGRRAVVFGDADLVVGLASFLNELGIQPVLCATGARGSGFSAALQEVVTDVDVGAMRIIEGADHAQIAEAARELKPDLLLGSSKGYPLARELDVPLLRAGFPIHDRIGGQRLLHLGYRGAQRLFDQIVNALLERRQDDSEVGYSYL